MKKATVKTVAYWITTVLGPASFVIGGIVNLTQAEPAIATLQHLGYPSYFAFILGTGKLLGALAIVIPGHQRIKEWAYAGFFFNLTAAAFSRAAVGDPAADVIAPLVFLAFVMASWVLQPVGRGLPAAAGN